MTHYETLGVPPDASPEDIKRAFRRKASQHHPDREGGDPEKMAAVNRAWLVLQDPDKRKRYDETGEDADEPPVEAQARDLLASMFAAVIDKAEDSFAKLVGQLLDHERREVQQKRATAEKNRTRLQRRRKKIKVKEGENIVHHLIDAKLAEIERGIAAGEKVLQVIAAATCMLEAYEDEPPDPPPAPEVRRPAFLSDAFFDAGVWGRGL
jgi:curved DNA-binding protein CbpA